MRKLVGIILIMALMTSGCASLVQGDEPAGEKVKEKKEEKKEFEPATTVEGMLREGPGKYAGDKYDEAKVNAELDKLGDNLTADEAYKHIVQLLAEDYGPLVDGLDQIDPTIEVDVETPDGEMNAPPEAKEFHVSILLDASGSMAQSISGGKKMDLAKRAIQGFVSNLPESAQVSIRVYGHKGSNSSADKKVSCGSSEVIYPAGKPDTTQVKKAISSIQPAGWTPLASAIKSAKKEIAGMKKENVKNIVYVVSDGKETCDGDPVAAAKSLHESDIEAVVNIIGLDLNNSEQQALRDVASAGGGEYTSVQSQEELEEHFEKERERINAEWESWELNGTLEAGSIYVKKLALYNDIDGKIIVSNQREGSRMDKAMWYLNEKKRLQGGEYGEEYNKLEKELVTHRWRLIGEYRRDRYLHMSDELKTQEKGAQEEIEKRAEEGKISD
ncbi:VWA domain-containing protein [Mechercharimyces sp. CAU 1602]|uniref:vWA domain-containing protein n=1 Tax=Mechercharimyces sp. CAU 1602 TaxID=2973933 RepID=UPI002161FA45|nr:VWA domain-containing protein [Mechercharimyces sp. CAU 1602]MCS1351660.1 VWA domain-containing protein [Mechercharimyces sp. CAU 1602]